MFMKDLTLIEPNAELKEDFLAMAEEFEAEGDERFKDDIKDFSAYMERCRKYAQDDELPPGHVPSTLYWLVNGERRVLGQTSLRHRLSPGLEHEGGNIGYVIRPSERRKGYGTSILELVLQKAKTRGFDRVLITCDTDNTGSAKIIEKNGGKLFGHAVSDRSGKQISRYWIEIE